MSNFKFQKTFLAVSATAALAGLLLNGQAIAANDQGEVVFTAEILPTTCVLNLGDAASTSVGSRVINFGRIQASSASGVAVGTTIGAVTPPISLTLKDSGGANCTLPGTTKWDIGVDLPTTAYSTTAVPSTTVLLNQAAAGSAATNVALRISSTYTGNGTETNVDFATKNATYGTLLTRGAAPLMTTGQEITLYGRLVKTGASAVTAGSFTASIPLLVWYK